MIGVITAPLTIALGVVLLLWAAHAHHHAGQTTVVIQSARPTPSPPPVFSDAQKIDIDQGLINLSAAENRYFNHHGAYTDNIVVLEQAGFAPRSREVRHDTLLLGLSTRGDPSYCIVDSVDSLPAWDVYDIAKSVPIQYRAFPTAVEAEHFCSDITISKYKNVS